VSIGIIGKQASNYVIQFIYVTIVITARSTERGIVTKKSIYLSTCLSVLGHILPHFTMILELFYAESHFFISLLYSGQSFMMFPWCWGLLTL